MNIEYKNFYDKNRKSNYAHDYKKLKCEDHWAHNGLFKFIKEYNLTKKRCLEIGSSGGMFQDLVDDYTGIDIAESLREFYHKPYFVVEKSYYPFQDSDFDVIWTIAVFEHIPDIDDALNELKRVLKKDGLVYFYPAWNVRSWASNGLAVRPYSDLSISQKVKKLLIPILESFFYRSVIAFHSRVLSTLFFFFNGSLKNLKYKKLNANYEKYWVNDADACNAIDPYDAILWFVSHGFTCVSHKNNLSKFFIRTGPIIFKKK
jgi:SAM-dependent methyltransferase